MSSRSESRGMQLPRGRRDGGYLLEVLVVGFRDKFHSV